MRLGNFSPTPVAMSPPSLAPRGAAPADTPGHPVRPTAAACQAAGDAVPALIMLGVSVTATFLLFEWEPLASGEKPTMKHFLLLLVMTMLGTVGATVHPFWGVLLYYTLAVLRPQHLWGWALPVEWRWSLIAAAVALTGVLLNLNKIVGKGAINRIMWIMLSYGLLLLLSCLTAYDPAIAQQWGTEYAKILLMALVAGLVINQLWQVRAITAMILLMLGYVAYEVNSLYFFKGRLDIFHYGLGGLDNNGAGLMLAMGVPFAYAWGVSAPRRWMKVGAWCLGLFMLHAIMMSYSRGAMVSVAVGIIWLLLNHRSRMGALAIALVLAVAVSLLAGREIRDRFISTGAFHRDDSAQSRFESWDAAWKIALDHPLTGQGIRNSNTYTHNYGADRLGRTVHSQYLQVAADSGIPAMLLFIVMLATALIYLGRSRRMCLRYLSEARRGDPNPELAGIRQTADSALACQASLIIFAFGGLFLSLEVFELPWLIMVLAGVLPGLLSQHLAQLPELAAPEDSRPARRSRKLTWPARRRSPWRRGRAAIPPLRTPRTGVVQP